MLGVIVVLNLEARPVLSSLSSWSAQQTPAVSTDGERIPEKQNTSWTKNPILYRRCW
jgi:hypothetical protein